MKTKLWQVIWGLKDGGAEVLAKEYARLVDKERFDTTIVTMYPFKNTANYLCAVEAGIRIISIFKHRNVLTRAVRVLAGKWYIPFVLKCMIAKDQPDTIHFNSPMAHYFLPLQKKLNGIVLLYTCHNEPDKHFFPKEENTVRQLIQNTDLRLVALHEDMQNELEMRFSIKDTVVIRNGIDLHRFREVGINREAILRNIGIAENAYVIGHIGRFSQQKNHAFLLQIFQKILERKSNAHLLLVGSGELKEEIVREITRLHLEDRVTILSHRTDIPDLLHAMDVMVFPSFFEGLSVTLVEAQASGLRCVISDSINPANILSENTIAVSLKEGPEVWADIALDDTIKCKTYGNIEDYDMNREIHRLERLYLGEQDV